MDHIKEYTFFALWLGFNVETVEYKNISFTVWDVGGQDKVIIYLNFSITILVISFLCAIN